MKKKFFFFLLSFVFLFALVSPKGTLAACVPPNDYGLCPDGYGLCSNGQCCNTACPTIKPTIKPTSKPTPASSASDPTCEGTGISTAIGCIGGVLSDQGPEEFIGDILRWAIGVGGGIAFLLI